MKQLNPALVETVRQVLKGARLAKFEASVAIINESLAQECWVLRGAVKARSGFYQGLAKVQFRREEYDDTTATGAGENDAWHLMMTLNYGHPFRGKDLQRGIEVLRNNEAINKKLTDESIVAWAALCDEMTEIHRLLDEARPKPVITAVGLSPKVTKTLKEMNLDIDLPSIRRADLEKRYRPAFDRKGQPILDQDGKQMMESYHVVVWTKGIVHGTSRFSRGCEACGKPIPSCRYVPVEAMDKRSGKLISLWLGCDCARNIFGIKDVGVEK